MGLELQIAIESPPSFIKVSDTKKGEPPGSPIFVSQLAKPILLAAPQPLLPQIL